MHQQAPHRSDWFGAEAIGRTAKGDDDTMRLTYRELLLMKRLVEDYVWTLEEWDAALGEMPEDLAIRERPHYDLLRSVHASLWRKVGEAVDRRADRLTPDQRKRSDLFGME